MTYHDSVKADIMNHMWIVASVNYTCTSLSTYQYVLAQSKRQSTRPSGHSKETHCLHWL